MPAMAAHTLSSRQYCQALQTLERLRDAIMNDPASWLKAHHPNVDRMLSAESQLESTQLAVETLNSTITTLEAQISLFTAPGPETPSHLPAPDRNPFYNLSTPVHRSAKLANPHKFSGKRTEQLNLLVQLQLKLQANEDHWPDEAAKVAYCISQLEGHSLRNRVRYSVGRGGLSLARPHPEGSPGGYLTGNLPPGPVRAPPPLIPWTGPCWLPRICTGARSGV